jgi:hypothetical protein
MQETKTRAPAEDLPPPRPPWIRVVAMLGVVALLAGTLYGAWQAVASNDDPGETVPDTSDPDFSLTDEQAIQTFERLSSTLRLAVTERDSTLVASVTTNTGNTGARVSQEIRRLKKDRVVDQTRVERIRSEVVISTTDRIEIREVIRLHPCFETESGQDITEADAVVEQIGIWTLAVENGRWLVDDTQLEKDRVIDDGSASCDA